MVGFWLESNKYPNVFVEWFATWVLWLWAVVFCIAWVWLRIRAPRFTCFDSAIFLLPLTLLWLYLTF